MSDITVVKCGGHAAVDPAAVCADIAELRASGRPVVLVHGGSADIDALAGRLGVAPRRLVAPDGVSTRYTDAAMLDVVQLALAGAVKPRLVAHLARHGVPAVGLTGLDAGLVSARRATAHRTVRDGRLVLVRDNHSGRITAVDVTVPRLLLAQGIVPVLSPPALAEDGAPVNVDADRVAAAVAGALRASALVLLTGAAGVLRDPTDDRTWIPRVELASDEPTPKAGGGMAIKLFAGREALRAGVDLVVIARGGGRRPVRTALDGGGTVLALRTAPAGAV